MSDPRAERPAGPRRKGPRTPSADRGGAGRSAGAAAGGGRFAGSRAGGQRAGRDRGIEERDPYGTKSVRSRHDDPDVPADVQAAQLDRAARAQLKTLSKDNADDVARHLVMAARLIATDPELAHRHATSAARRAGRIAVVRETLAITAYSVGDFALTLRELRTYRRISGRDDQLPMMVDSERGLGRPDKALELGRSVPRGSLPAEVQVELSIAMSGARLDLGQLDQALAELETERLDPDTAYSWSPALFGAYATVLEDLGRTGDAELWFRRADRAQEALDAAAGAIPDETVEIVEEDVVVEEDVAVEETPVTEEQTVEEDVVAEEPGRPDGEGERL